LGRNKNPFRKIKCSDLANNNEGKGSLVFGEGGKLGIKKGAYHTDVRPFLFFAFE
jgi:hypothetical protein